MKTSDLCDAHGDKVRVAEPMWSDFGGIVEFDGPAHCLRVPDDNSLVREALQLAGEGRVLVVDGGGSMRCALLGGNLAALAEKNDWAGVIVNGCIRDSEETMACQIGVKALATHPRKSDKQGRGEAGVIVGFGGIVISPGDHIYADEDGLVVSSETLVA